jgi:hypothetical protein
MLEPLKEIFDKKLDAMAFHSKTFFDLIKTNENDITSERIAKLEKSVELVNEKFEGVSDKLDLIIKKLFN